MDKNKILSIFNEVVESWIQIEEMHTFEKSTAEGSFPEMREMRETIEVARKEFLEVLEGKDVILEQRLKEIERMTKLY